MMTNEGTTDRILRVALGLVFFSIALMFGGILKPIALVLGTVMLVTAAVGFCPLYRIFGLNTCPVKK